MHLIPNWLQWRDGPLSKQPLQAAEEALKEAKAFTASRNEELQHASEAGPELSILKKGWDLRMGWSLFVCGCEGSIRKEVVLATQSSHFSLQHEMLFALFSRNRLPDSRWL